MTKRIFSLFLILLLCAMLPLSVFATEAEVATQTEEDLDLEEYFVFDDADLLTDAEEAALDEKLRTISEKYQAQVILATVDTLDGEDIDNYLEYSYDLLELGYGENRDGVYLLICMDTREYRILSNGFAGDAIDSDAIEDIGEEIQPSLSAGNYVTAFQDFAAECEYYLDGYLNGFPFDFVKAFLIALGAGLLIALIITSGWKNQLKSVRKENKANAYVKAGSLQITQSGDYFMYRNVTTTERQQSSSGRSGSSRSTGGGSF